MGVKKSVKESAQSISVSLSEKISGHHNPELKETIFVDYLFIRSLINYDENNLPDTETLSLAAIVYGKSIENGWIEETTTFGDFVLESIAIAKRPMTVT